MPLFSYKGPQRHCLAYRGDITDLMFVQWRAMTTLGLLRPEPSQALADGQNPPKLRTALCPHWRFAAC
jgi:hypothetical protein